MTVVLEYVFFGLVGILIGMLVGAALSRHK
jgi:hypothetical protein